MCYVYVCIYMIGDVWWHDHQQQSLCGIIRPNRNFVIPGDGHGHDLNGYDWTKWSIDEQLWMRCSTISWYPFAATESVIVSKIKTLLDSKANSNYSYRGCTIFEATILSHSNYAYAIIALLQQYGCNPLTHQIMVHNHRRGLIATTIADADPFSWRLILHAPLSTQWSTAVMLPSINNHKSLGSNNSLNSTGKQGRTVGVDGGSNWLRITDHAVATASVEETKQIPWLIWAYGVDIKRVTRLATTEYGTPEIWSLISPKWNINQIIEVLHSHGYDSRVNHHDSVTGNPLPQRLYCNDQSKWIGARIIDVARSPVTNRICIRVTPIKFPTIFDE
jgi:hypothetical protein